MYVSRPQNGFTLVELLVVIAIIGVLIAMIIPAISESKSTARQTVCGANVHTWQLVELCYSNDHKGFFPTRGATWPNVMGSTWAGLTNPYLDRGLNTTLTTQIKYFFCPDGVIDANWRASWQAINGRSMEYSIYAAMPSPVGAAAPRMPTRNDDLRDQFGRMKIMVADVARWGAAVTNFDSGSPMHTTHAARNKPIYTYASGALPGFIYKNGIPRGLNVGYVDGSIRWNHWIRMDLTKYISTTDLTYMWDAFY